MQLTLYILVVNYLRFTTFLFKTSKAEVKVLDLKEEQPSLSHHSLRSQSSSKEQSSHFIYEGLQLWYLVHGTIDD